MPRTCNRPHDQERMERELASIRASQSKEWRHKCAACAYEKGVEYGRELGKRDALAAMKRDADT